MKYEIETDCEAELISAGHPKSNKRRTVILAGLAGMLSSGLTQAQSSWPNRAIHLVVPFSAGGAADTSASCPCCLYPDAAAISCPASPNDCIPPVTLDNVVKISILFTHSRFNKKS